MQISFDIAGTPAEFRRKSTTGAAELVIGEQGEKVVELANPLHPSTHFSLSTEQTWQCQVGERTVEILKVRPRVVGGLRESSYTVLVDDEVVATANGT
jgi:hypothetical protein